MQLKFDFLVVGSGLAGLSYALKVAPFGKVGIITKTTLEETNTYYAQGGIAAVTYQPDSYQKHVEDTLIAGDGLCNKKVVEMVIKEAPLRIKELIEWGANFDKKPDGIYDLAKEGGHSEKRILHHKDKTGYELQRALLEKVKQEPSIEIFEYHFALGYHYTTSPWFSCGTGKDGYRVLWYLCIKQQDKQDTHYTFKNSFSCYRRHWKCLSHHNQSANCNRRRYCHGYPCTGIY
jgi:aspartate oxidase